VVQVIEVIAAAIEADITSTDTSGVDEFALIGFNVMFIFADAKAGGVVNIVIKKSSDVRDKIRAVGNLYYDIKINAWLLVEIPYHNSVNLVHSLPVDGNMLGELLVCNTYLQVRHSERSDAPLHHHSERSVAKSRNPFPRLRSGRV